MAIEIKELSVKINLDDSSATNSKKDGASSTFDCDSETEKERTMHIVAQCMEQVRKLMARKEER